MIRLTRRSRFLYFYLIVSHHPETRKLLFVSSYSLSPTIFFFLLPIVIATALSPRNKQFTNYLSILLPFMYFSPAVLGSDSIRAGALILFVRSCLTSSTPIPKLFVISSLPPVTPPPPLRIPKIFGSLVTPPCDFSLFEPVMVGSDPVPSARIFLFLKQ